MLILIVVVIILVFRIVCFNVLEGCIELIVLILFMCVVVLDLLVKIILY